MTPKRFTESNLAQVCSLVTDGTHDTPRPISHGYPLIKAKEIIGGRIDFESCAFISEEEHQKVIARSKPEKGDTLFTHIGASLGEAAYVNTTKEFSIKNIALFKPDPDIIFGRYLYYLTISPQFQKLAISTRTGSAQPFLSLGHLRSHRIRYHTGIKEQKKIATVLSAYDDLIESINRRIRILEEMAKLIYQEWFVNYRFPGHENVKMVDSPMGKIPEGWTYSKLDNVLTELESGSRPKGGVAESEEGIPSIGAENILGLGKYEYSKEKYVNLEFFSKMRRGHVKSGDVLLYKDGAQIGRKSMFRDNFPYDTCCINEHVFILRCNNRITQNYLFFWLDFPDMTEMIRNLNANAAQPGINQASVRGLPILIPTREVLDVFQNTVEPLIALLFNLAKQNRILQITRDCTLPKLISGEIDVSDLDIDIGEEPA